MTPTALEDAWPPVGSGEAVWEVGMGERKGEGGGGGGGTRGVTVGRTYLEYDFFDWGEVLVVKYFHHALLARVVILVVFLYVRC